MTKQPSLLALGLVAIATSLSTYGGAFGTPPSVPPVNKDSIVGVWEAINPSGPEVLRIDVRKAPPHYAALAIGVNEPAEATTFAIRSLSVANGKVALAADDVTDHSPFSIAVSAEGRAGGGSGTLEATVVFLDRTSGIKRRWKSTLVQTQRGYLSDLGRLARATENAIRQKDVAQLPAR